MRAIVQFFNWCDDRNLELDDITPFAVAAYVEEIQKDFSAPSVKQHMAAIRTLMTTYGITDPTLGLPEGTFALEASEDGYFSASQRLVVGPAGSTWRSTQSPSQSRSTRPTASVWPLDSPFFQSLPREREWKWATPVDSVRASASRDMKATMRTSPVSASCATAGTRPCT